MSAWTDDELAALDRAHEIQVDGAISWSGQTRDVTYATDASHEDEIDAAYFAKYGNGASTRSITNDVAKQTTLRIDPN